MDILHEMNQLELGGIERVIATLAKYDAQNKHTVMAYKDGPMRAELEKVGARVVICEDEAERSFEADVVHLHCGGGVSELAPQVCGNTPIVETIHSPVTSPNRREWITQRIGVSRVVAEANPGAIVIYNGLDLPALQPIRPSGWLRKELGLREGVPVVGRIGRVGPDKCVEEFLLACQAAQEAGEDFEVVIAGPEALGAPGYLGKCLLLADSLPVKHCYFVGPHRAADFLNEIDVFLYPSPTEGFGLVFAEAMAMSKPIVTWGTAAAREVCAGHAVFTEESVPALAAGLLDVLRQPTLRAALIAESRETVQELFSAERMAAQYQDLYRSLVHAEPVVPAHPEPLGQGLAAR